MSNASTYFWILVLPLAMCGLLSTDFKMDNRFGRALTHTPTRLLFKFVAVMGLVESLGKELAKIDYPALNGVMDVAWSVYIAQPLIVVAVGMLAYRMWKSKSATT